MVLQVSKTSSSFSLSTALQAARFGRKKEGANISERRFTI